MGLAVRQVWPKMQTDRSPLGSQRVKLKSVYLTMARRRFFRRGAPRLHRSTAPRTGSGPSGPGAGRPPLHLDEYIRTSLFLESARRPRNSPPRASYLEARQGRSQHCSSILPRKTSAFILQPACARMHDEYLTARSALCNSSHLSSRAA